MVTIQCQMDIPAVEGLKGQELTVGREFYLICKGDWPRDLKQDQLHLIFPEQAKYQVQLLGFEFRTPEQAELRITSHKAMPSRFENLQITDGQQTLDLGLVQYQVQTVIEKPQDPNQKVEAYGPMGPAVIPIPALYLAILGLVLLSILTWIGIKIFRMSQRRRLLQRLKAHDAALSPLHQYHQSMRRLQRDNTVFFGVDSAATDIPLAFEELHKMWRTFLTRELHVPAFEWSNALIMKDIKKYHRSVYNEFAGDLKKLLREYSQAAKNKNTLIDQDVVNLSDQTRRMVEKIDRFKDQHSKRGPA